MKRIIGLFVLMLTLTAAAALADAPVFQEQEPNNSRDQAQALCMNAPLTGALSYNNETEYDCYRLIVPATGRITVQLEHPYIDTSNNVLTLRVYYASSDSQLWYANVTGTQASVSYYSFYLGAGEYDLVLEGRYRGNLDYQLRVLYAAQPNGESENNNTPEAADPITLNADYFGSLSNDKDIDYYVVSVPEAGAVQFNFQHEYFDNTSNFYQVSITKGIGGASVRSLKVTGRESNWTSYPFYMSPGEYYIRIENYSYTDRPYQFRLSFTADPNTELESNNDFNSATRVPLNTGIKGSFTSDKDVDVYRFTVTEPGELVLHHEHEYFDNGSGFYEINLFDDARSDAQMFKTTLNGRDNDWTRYAVYLAPGDYYLQYSSYYHTFLPYTFTLNFTPVAHIEVERNNTYNSATPIETNTDYKGALMTDKDLDYYAFTLTETSEVQIGLDFTYFDDGGTYFKLFLDTAAKNDSTYYTANLKGRDSGYASYPFYLPAGTYYVHVASYFWSGRPYTLRVSAKPCPNAELEWNNNYNSATPIALKQPVHGSLRYDGDVDYYVLNVPATTTVNLHLTHEWFDEGAVYYRVALDAQPNNSQRLYTLEARGRENDKLSDAIVLQPGTYYISVYKNYLTARPYVLTVE